MKITQTVIAACFAALILLSGCANTDSRSGATYGAIEGIEITRGSSGSGDVTVIGCGVTGEEVVDQPRVAEGAASAIDKEKGNRQQYKSHIRVRLESGAYLTMTQPGSTDLRVGDRVRIENDRVSRY